MSEDTRPSPNEEMMPHLRDVATWCRRRCKDFHLAEDIVQEVALTAIAQIPRLRDPLRIRPWLFRIAQRRLADLRRSRCPEVPLSFDPPAPSADARNGLERKRVAEIRRAVQRLPVFLRKPVRLHYLKGRSLRDVAASLDTTVNGVKARLYRARHLLREEEELWRR